MRENFGMAVSFVLKHEGGYVNDPDDPGGETKYGIAKRYHPSTDIRDLTEQEAAKIYFDEYWMPLADSLPFPIDVVAMDTCVNIGVKKSQGFLMDAPSWELFLMRRIRYYSDKVIENPVKIKFFFGWMIRCMDLYRLIKDELKKRR